MKFDVDNYEMTINHVKEPKNFINRELSWIDFNKRVLVCAVKKSNPINERFNFLGITESNLDEFISVRFAYAYANKDKEPYKEILKRIKKFKDEQNEVYKRLMITSEKNFNLSFRKPKDLNKNDKDKLHDIFKKNIFPRLTPINISNNNMILESGLTYISVIIKINNIESVVVIPIVKEIESFVIINKSVIFVEDIILYFMQKDIFINQEVSSIGVFRIIKDASVILSHDSNKFIVDRMEDTLKKRFEGKPLFLQLRKDTDERMADLLMAIFKIPNGHVYSNNIVSSYKLFSKHKLFNDNYSYEGFEPFYYEKQENYYDIFEALREEDILLHHPYDSYDTVVKFIQHSASDKNTESIKMTLYRVSSVDSPIVNALCDAAYNGKRVTVLVEIKARFDEENNIRVIDKLKKYGVNVIYGDEYLKTHCKLCIVTRKEDDGIKIYSHVATGNYNEKTAKLYTDLSFMTSKNKIGYDLLNIFNILSGYARPDDKLARVYYAPVNLRKQLIKCINNEINIAKKGHKAEIFIKVNSISDPIMVDKLYEAADKGVKVYVICRGICSLVPRKNLFIKSIVGRFLEHSRIYYFKNNGKNLYYISSADLLTRNLDRRVETLINVTESSVTKYLKWIIQVLIQDKDNSFIIDKNGKWSVCKDGDFDAHQWMIDYTDIKKQKKKWRK